MPVFDLAQDILDVVRDRLVPEIEIGDGDNIRTHRVSEIGLAPSLSSKKAIPFWGVYSIPFISRLKRSALPSRGSALHAEDEAVLLARSHVLSLV